MSLDVGSKTIGLALSDEGGRIASALGVISRKGHQADAREVQRYVIEREVGRVVVGLPLELDGRCGHRARLVQRFVEVLEARLGTPVNWWDERFSTAAAERTLLEADVSRSKRKRKIDALAAQFILQGWLDGQAGSGDAEREAYEAYEAYEEYEEAPGVCETKRDVDHG